MSAMKDLIRLLPPPSAASVSVDASEWDSVQRTLGTELPSDYKEFVSIYGSGAIDGFLWILNPFSGNRHLNLLEEGRAKLDALGCLMHETVPYPFYPEPNGILPCGVTDNGDVVFWVCAGNPSRWSVVINEGRGPRWRDYKLSLVEFLVQIISRSVIVDLFPPDFPSGEPEFLPF